MGSDSVLNIQSNWNAVEFNIVGDGNGDQAEFNSGATVGVRIAVDNGTIAAPSCVSGAGFDGFTGETNNLNLVPGSCCPVGGPSQSAILFLESNASAVTRPFCLLNDIAPILSAL
jgi:hypothetical protein